MNPRPRPRRPPAPAQASIRWENVLAHFTDAVVVMDCETRIVLFNQAAEELTGRPHRRVLGRPCARVFAEAPLLVEMVERVQRLRQSESRGEEHLRCRGQGVPARITCMPLWDERDSVHGTALVIQDLSHQKRLAEAASRNENLARLGTLVAGLAHEVRNPLAGIKGAAQLLGQRLGEQSDLAEYTAVIVREAERLSGLVEDLLTLGAPAKPRLAAVNIHRVIQHVLSLMAGELTRREIQLRCRFDPSLPDIQGDEAQLSQVFINVLKNAIEAMTVDGKAQPRRDTITISTRMETDFHILRKRDRSSKFLSVEIADQGAGIDRAQSARAFEPFFTTKAGGTGLGLAISHKIVAEHGGVIRTVPYEPVGTAVTVTLPVVRS